MATPFQLEGLLWIAQPILYHWAWWTLVTCTIETSLNGPDASVVNLTQHIEEVHVLSW